MHCPHHNHRSTLMPLWLNNSILTYLSVLHVANLWPYSSLLLLIFILPIKREREKRRETKSQERNIFLWRLLQMNFFTNNNLPVFRPHQNAGWAREEIHQQLVTLVFKKKKTQVNIKFCTRIANHLIETFDCLLFVFWKMK